MLSLVATGYVTGKPKIESSDYGDSCTIGIRVKGNNGKSLFYVNAKFYGKRMAVIEQYINDGAQVTVSGSITGTTEKTSKDGNKYTSIYMNGQDFTLPPSPEGANTRSSGKKSAPSDEEVPF